MTGEDDPPAGQVQPKDISRQEQGNVVVTLASKGTVNQTIQYLQSESAEQGIEIGVLVNFLLLDAITAGASDIHIEPWESTLVVRIRLSGVLTELVHLPLELMEKISGRFKVMANLISYQTGLPQEGHASAPDRTFAALVDRTLLAHPNSPLRYSQRLALLKEAGRRGIGRFEANLIIASVQHRLKLNTPAPTPQKSLRLPLFGIQIAGQC